MSGADRPPTTEDLPKVLPIFPLTGVLLLPRGRLPLNIFEPRYLEMTEDAMSSHRTIGMIQPTDPHDCSERPEVYETGCLGRITQFSETDDDRFLIMLTGTCRFDIAQELPPDGIPYRRVYASYQAYEGDLLEPTEFRLDRERLMPTLRSYFQTQGMTADWDTIDQTADDSLLTYLAMICPFKPNEKQALLESGGEAERSRTMLTLMEMATHERTESSAQQSLQ